MGNGMACAPCTFESRAVSEIRFPQSVTSGLGQRWVARLIAHTGRACLSPVAAGLGRRLGRRWRVRGTWRAKENARQGTDGLGIT